MCSLEQRCTQVQRRSEARSLKVLRIRVAIRIGVRESPMAHMMSTNLG